MHLLCLCLCRSWACLCDHMLPFMDCAHHAQQQTRQVRLACLGVGSCRAFNSTAQTAEQLYALPLQSAVTAHGYLVPVLINMGCSAYTNRVELAAQLGNTSRMIQPAESAFSSVAVAQHVGFMLAGSGYWAGCVVCTFHLFWRQAQQQQPRCFS